MTQFRQATQSFCLVILAALSVHAQQPTTGPFAEVSNEPGLPRVLLLGDSISIGYTVPVRQMLRGRANVHRAPENCGPTVRGLEKLDHWLGQTKWDLIHFNFGLHDLKYMDDSGRLASPTVGRQQVPPDAYHENLTGLIQRLQRTGAKLVWCTTTPVPEGASGRIAGDSAKYNQIAGQVVGEVGNGQIAIDDLYQFAASRLDQIQQPRNVHFTPEGSRQLGKQVAEVIASSLGLASPTPTVARGVVFHDRNGNRVLDPGEPRMPNIRVSNGRQIVTTDSQGTYQLLVDDDTTLFVVKPRGWRTPVSNDQLPRFYYVHKPYGSPGLEYGGVAPTGALPSSVDFPLYPQQEPEQFKAVLFGDPQPRDQKEVDYIAHDVVEELIGTDASFGVTLGDIVFDDLSLFESQARMIALLGIPWYNVIGNHDINYDARHDHHSDETFERVFGPAYYSFDHGPVHFLVLDDVEWFVDEGDGSGKYRGGLGADQMEFIRNDLAAIPEDQLVVLLMHIPLVDVHDRQELYRLIEKRPFCMSISAHRHVHQHHFITSEDGWMGPEPHHHVVNVTVSGSWWSGAQDERSIPHTMMADGAPNGYSIITFDGYKYRIEFKAAGRPADYQMSIHAPELAEAAKQPQDDVYVNVFNGSEKSEVAMRVGDGGQWQTMTRRPIEDPYYQRIFSAEAAILEKLQSDNQNKQEPWLKLTSPKFSTHLWHVKLPAGLKPGTHLLEVRTTDMHGREYHGRRVIRIR